MRDGGVRVVLIVGVLVPVLVAGGRWGGPAEAADGESAFVGLTPCRLVDTRGNGFGGAFGPPALATGIPRDFPLQGQCGIPTTATAVSLNVTATSTQGPGFLLLYPQAGAQPLVSTLNYVAGETVANAALVPFGPGGLTVVAGVSGTDLILDVNGYFTDSLVHGLPTDNLFVGPGTGNLATIGVANTAVGALAFGNNTTGTNNTAVGTLALGNISGHDNIAVGAFALQANRTGGDNTAVGTSALVANLDGSGNTAIGFNALGLSKADGNVAIGANAGSNLTNGGDNIDIGHRGVAGEASTIRIGDTQTSAYMAGIYGRSVNAGNEQLVRIDADGKLGTLLSSRRVKTDIEDIGERSAALHALRPVSFRFRSQEAPGSPVQYGLIAEEVAEVYPELILRDAEGAPLTVRDHLLPALLLNELQRQARALAEKDREFRAQVERLHAQEARLTELATKVAELMAEMARLRAQGPAAARHREVQ